MNTAMSLRVPYNAKNFLNTSTATCFRKRDLFQGVSQLLYFRHPALGHYLYSLLSDRAQFSHLYKLWDISRRKLPPPRHSEYFLSCYSCSPLHFDPMLLIKRCYSTPPWVKFRKETNFLSVFLVKSNSSIIETYKKQRKT